MYKHAHAHKHSTHLTYATHTQTLIHAHLKVCATKCAHFDMEVKNILVTWKVGLSQVKIIT